MQVSPKALTLQVSQQESIVLTWLKNSGIPYEIEQMTLPDSSETPIGIAPNRVIFPLQSTEDNYLPVVAGDKIAITAIFSAEDFPHLRGKLASTFGEIVEDETNNTIAVQIVSEAVVIRTRKKIGILALQMSVDEADNLQFIMEMQIPYKMEELE